MSVVGSKKKRLGHADVMQEIEKKLVEQGLRVLSDSAFALEDMIFFDNERGNCTDVAPLGVTCVYCPAGVTDQIWRLALEGFPAPKGTILGP